MNPGRYDKRITFVSKIRNDDGIGGGDMVTSDLIKVWANVVQLDTYQSLQLSQSLRLSQVYSGTGYNIECRNLKTVNLTTKNGILFEGKLLSIHSIDPVTDKNKIKIIAFE